MIVDAGHDLVIDDPAKAANYPLLIMLDDIGP